MEKGDIKTTNYKLQFVSSLEKIYSNLDRIAEFQRTGILFPITLDFGPTNRCNLNCSFCSVKNRDRTTEISWELARTYLDFYAARGIKAIELTGSGEPTLWPHFIQFCTYCKEKYPEIGLGLITNGLTLKGTDDLNWSVLSLFDWIRISLNAFDVGISLMVPCFPKHVTISYSYVYNQNTTPEIIDQLMKFLDDQYNHYDVFKIQMDVLDKDLEISPYFKEKLLEHQPGYFINKKKSTFIPKRCYMGFIKPHLSANGRIYRCSCNALIKQKFDERYCLGTYKDIPLQPDFETFDTSICQLCFFGPQNEFIDHINQTRNLKHGRFL